MKKLELLSPAGDMERLKMAVQYGADAVYLAGTSFGMRSLLLTEGVHYGQTLPAPGVPGRIFFQVVSE